MIVPGTVASSRKKGSANLPAEAYSFDGVDSRLSFPHTTALNFENNTPFTFEAWVNFPTVAGTPKYLWCKYDNATARGMVILANTSRLTILIRNNNSTNQINLVTAAYNNSALAPFITSELHPVNRWIHVVVRYDGSLSANGVKIYYDSREYITKTVSNNTLTGTIQNTQPVIIGNGNNTSWSDHKQGLTRMFNRALSQAEINDLYNNGQPKQTLDFSGCVFEMKVSGDVFGTQYTVAETALGNNGVSAGMTAGQKFTVTDMDGMPDATQVFTGSKLYYDTFGTAGGEPTTAVMHSPFSDRFRTPIFYDAESGRTYIGWQQRPGVGFNRISRLFYVDHFLKAASVSGKGNYIYAGTSETHSAPSVTGLPGGEILLGHEEGHSSPIYMERTQGKNPQSLKAISTITGFRSYVQFNAVGSTLFAYTRGANAWGDAVYEDDQISFSTDGGTTWSTPLTVLNTNLNAGFWERPYFLTIHGTDKLRVLVQRRDDNDSVYHRVHYIESTDGITWTNLGGSFSKNISAAGFITRTELEANCTALYNGDVDVLVKAAVKTATGMIVGIANDGTGGYKVLYTSGSTWNTKTLNIPTFIAAGHSSTSRADFFVLHSYSDTRFLFWRIEARNGFNVVVQYETTDFFTTLDAGTVVSDANKNHEQLQGTHNIQGVPNIVIAASEVGATYNKLFLYDYTRDILT